MRNAYKLLVNRACSLMSKDQVMDYQKLVNILVVKSGMSSETVKRYLQHHKLDLEKKLDVLQEGWKRK